MAESVKINEAGFKSVFESQEGPIGRDLWSRAGRVKTAAKAQAGVKSGKLKASIDRAWVRGNSKYRLSVKIGSSVNHALVHHQGSHPRVVTPKNARVMRFMAGGRVVFARTVKYPGSKANHYLSDNLKLAGGVSRVR